MSEDNRMSNELTLKGPRLAFPDLFVPTAFKEGQPLQYGAVFLIPKGSDMEKQVNDAITRVATEKWGKQAEAVLKSIKPVPQSFCFMDGDNKTNLDGYEGHMALSSKNKRRPTVVDADASPLTKDDERPYAGCYVVAKVEIWAQQNEHGKAVRCSLLGVQFYRDGDSFSAGRVSSADEFEDLSDEGNTDTSTLL